MECGTIACGLSFNGYEDDKVTPKFDRVQSAGLWNLEFSCRVKDFLANWNISVTKWLKYYVYLRMMPNDKKRGGTNVKAAFTTFLVSAIWHGFYPGFYLFFAQAAILDYGAKAAGQVLGPHVESKLPGWLVFCLSWLWCYAFCAYFAIAFALLSFENAIKVYSSMFYIGHIIVFSSIALVHLIPREKKEKVAASDKQKDMKTD